MPRTLLCDIEADGLLDTITTVHSLCCKEYETGEVWSFADQPGYHSIREGLDFLSAADPLVFHNGQKYDIPALQKVYGDACPIRDDERHYDTLTISNLIWTDLKERDFRQRKTGKNRKMPGQMIGRHGLEAWGYRLGVNKDSFGKQTDWSDWSEEMQRYCEQDVEVTEALWSLIRNQNYSEEAIRLEHDFRRVIFQQEQHGWPFDEESAIQLYAELSAKRQELEQRLQETFPARVEEMKVPAYYRVESEAWDTSFLTDTKKEAQAECRQRGWKPKDYSILPGPPRTKEHPFQPSSRDQIAERLVERHGWKPAKFSEKTGKPTADESVLEQLDYPEIPDLLEYLLVDKRIGQIAEGKEAWLKAVHNGRIHGEVATNGTVTGRCSHRRPNVAQTPASKVPYGDRCRSLWTVLPGYKLVGGDASGLELRDLAHFLGKYDDGRYAKVVVEGDVHTANQEAAGLPTRDKAKTFIYAFIYGAGDYKIGTITGVTPEEVKRFKGQSKAWQSARKSLERQMSNPTDRDVALVLKGRKLKAEFLKRTPGLEELIAAIKRAAGFRLQRKGDREWWEKDPNARRSHLIGLDGRSLFIRSAHSAPNTLLQSAGALIMKQSLVILDGWLRQGGYLLYEYPSRTKPGDYDVAYVGNIHDEIQMMVKAEYAEAVGRMIPAAISAAGEYFDFRCPLTGEYQIGDNWSQTH